MLEGELRCSAQNREVRSSLRRMPLERGTSHWVGDAKPVSLWRSGTGDERDLKFAIHTSQRGAPSHRDQHGGYVLRPRASPMRGQ